MPVGWIPEKITALLEMERVCDSRARLPSARAVRTGLHSISYGCEELIRAYIIIRCDRALKKVSLEIDVEVMLRQWSLVRIFGHIV